MNIEIRYNNKHCIYTEEQFKDLYEKILWLLKGMSKEWTREDSRKFSGKRSFYRNYQEAVLEKIDLIEYSNRIQVSKLTKDPVTNNNILEDLIIELEEKLELLLIDIEK